MCDPNTKPGQLLVPREEADNSNGFLCCEWPALNQLLNPTSFNRPAHKPAGPAMISARQLRCSLLKSSIFGFGAPKFEPCSCLSRNFGFLSHGGLRRRGFVFVCPCTYDAVNVLRAAFRRRFPSLSPVAFITQKAIAIVCFLPRDKQLAWLGVGVIHCFLLRDKQVARAEATSPGCCACTLHCFMF